MTTTDAATDPRELAHGGSLGACLHRVLRHLIESGDDRESFALSPADWPRCEPAFRAALTRARAVWFVGHDPTGVVDGPPAVARLCPGTGRVILDRGRPGASVRLPSAHGLGLDGSPRLGEADDSVGLCHAPSP